MTTILSWRDRFWFGLLAYCGRKLGFNVVEYLPSLAPDKNHSWAVHLATDHDKLVESMQRYLKWRDRFHSAP